MKPDQPAGLSARGYASAIDPRPALMPDEIMQHCQLHRDCCRRQNAKTEKQPRPGGSTAEDPDIAGIVPGPQPSPWEDTE